MLPVRVQQFMAKLGYIAPFIGAWFPVLVFTLLGVVLVRFSKT
jgi:lipopolysaccharide export system permease protein